MEASGFAGGDSLFKWIDDVMREKTILDAVEDLIGPDILCWNTLVLDQGVA